VREVSIHIYCDPCFANADTRVEVDENAAVRIGIADTPEARLDFCPDHRAELLTPLLQLLDAKGVRDDEPTQAEPSVGQRDWTCPLCTRSMRRSSALGHVWGTHRSGETRDLPTRCPDCDYKSDRPQAVGAHRVRVHGWDPLSEALTGART
jgi:hypothetical protein